VKDSANTSAAKPQAHTQSMAAGICQKSTTQTPAYELKSLYLES
jgi:hypothetical protein